MAGKVKRATAIATIDVELVTVKPESDPEADEIALDTASQIDVEPQIEESESVKLIIKNKLKAQKPTKSVLTSNQITLKDNVFTPELVKILQGGDIYYWEDAEKTSQTTTVTEFGIAGYEPPAVGSSDSGEPFTLCAYSAQYDASGRIVKYEKIEYPHCQGTPVAFGSEDDVFRSPEYTINSAASEGEKPYRLSYLDKPPIVEEQIV